MPRALSLLRHTRRVARFASTLRTPRGPPLSHCVGRGLDRCTALKRSHRSYPRGLALPELCCLGRHHLIDPIRPTRRHIAISPRSLISMSSLCGSAEATPRVVPSLSHIPFCMRLYDHGESVHVSSKFTMPTWSSPHLPARHSRNTRNPSTRAQLPLHWSLTVRLSDLPASPRRIDGTRQPPEALRQASTGHHPSRRWI